MANAQQINAVLFAARRGLAQLSEQSGPDDMVGLWDAFRAVSSLCRETAEAEEKAKAAEKESEP